MGHVFYVLHLTVPWEKWAFVHVGHIIILCNTCDSMTLEKLSVVSVGHIFYVLHLTVPWEKWAVVSVGHILIWCTACDSMTWEKRSFVGVGHIVYVPHETRCLERKEPCLDESGEVVDDVTVIITAVKGNAPSSRRVIQFQIITLHLQKRLKQFHTPRWCYISYFWCLSDTFCLEPP